MKWRHVLPIICGLCLAVLAPAVLRADYSSTTSSDGQLLAVIANSLAGGVGIGTTPATRTLVPLDVATVTTGGTAVNALSATHRSAGGWLYNPTVATVNLCINEIDTATGTSSAGNTTCIVPGQSYALAPTAGAVSVISSDSAHPFSGMGWQ